MLIGAHVSPAGGPAKAIARGIERGANAIQILNQNPRAWKPRDYSDEEVAQFRDAMAGSPGRGTQGSRCANCGAGTFPPLWK